MSNRKLELKDIVGYMPYDLHVQYLNGDIVPLTFRTLVAIYGSAKPILRPITDLLRTITHNGEKIIPIVECAKIAFPSKDWRSDIDIGMLVDYAYEINTVSDFRFMYSNCVESFVALEWQREESISFNQWELFDYLNSLMIDFRQLCEKDLAISVYDLEENPYE